MDFLETVKEWVEQLDITLFSIKGVEVSLFLIISAVVSLAVVYIISSFVRKVLTEKLLSRTKMDIGARQAIGAVV